MRCPEEIMRSPTTECQKVPASRNSRVWPTTIRNVHRTRKIPVWGVQKAASGRGSALSVGWSIAVARGLPTPDESRSHDHRDPGQRRDADPLTPLVRARREMEDDLVLAGRDLDAAEEKVGAMDGDRRAIHGAIPAGKPRVGQDQDS